jgi:hypothetical protein
MSTSKKRVKSLAERRPITLDMIDQANVDIDFVASFIDLLFAAGQANQFEAVESSSITCMCFHAKARLDALKMFARSAATCLDSSETAGNDRIKEETAVYESFKEFEWFEKFELFEVHH